MSQSRFCTKSLETLLKVSPPCMPTAAVLHSYWQLVPTAAVLHSYWHLVPTAWLPRLPRHTCKQYEIQTLITVLRKRPPVLPVLREVE
jgi:hypothetical protein